MWVHLVHLDHADLHGGGAVAFGSLGAEEPAVVASNASEASPLFSVGIAPHANGALIALRRCECGEEDVVPNDHLHGRLVAGRGPRPNRGIAEASVLISQQSGEVAVCE
jgi:hypothetical protein